jgi:uncharacterized protein
MTQVIIPWKSLTEAALTGVIEEFVTREGTEYGMREVPVATKVATVRRQLESGTAIIVYESSGDSVSIVPADVAGLV